MNFTDFIFAFRTAFLGFICFRVGDFSAGAGVSAVLAALSPPVFSSGVTIAMKSSSLAAKAIDRHFKGEVVDWQKDYADELMYGVNSFKAFVHAWYCGDLADIFYSKSADDPKIYSHICSILAGYAWDRGNPYTGENAARRLRTLAEICRG